MQTALQIPLLQIEKLRRRPIEIHPGVRTGVTIGIPVAMPVDKDPFDKHTAERHFKRPRTWIGYRTTLAE